MKKIVLTLIFTFALAATSASAMTFDVKDSKIDLYASARFYTVFNNTQVADSRSICGGSNGKNCSQFVIGLQDNSRAGVKWTQGNFFVNNEWGINSVDEASGQSLRLRYLYADYKFAGGKSGRIRFGQIPNIAFTSSIYDTKLSADNGMEGFGMIADVRRIGINYEIGGFSVSALSMRQDRANVTTVLGGTFNEIMPRFEVAYKYSSLTLAGSYVKSSARNGDNLNHVDAGHIMLTANPKIAEKTNLLISGFYAVNAGLYGMSPIASGHNDSQAINRSGVAARPSVKTRQEGGKITDFNNMSVYGGSIGFLIDKFEAGYGIQSACRDDYENDKTTMGFYANYKYRVGNFRITPEFRYLHAGDLFKDKGSEGNVVNDTRGIQFGVQFRMDI